jgi:NhaP-type Na+/H+ or K+/H+ antiporter
LAELALSTIESRANLTDRLFLATDLDADLVGPALFTVLVSVFAHGLSASPLVDYLARDREQRRLQASAAEIAQLLRWNPPHIIVRVRKGYGLRRHNLEAAQEEFPGDSVLTAAL